MNGNATASTSTTSTPGGTPPVNTILGTPEQKPATTDGDAGTNTGTATQDGSKKNEGEKKPETAPGTEGEKKPEATKDAAPPAEIVLKLPDGVQADPKLLDGFKAMWKEEGLEGAKAQKVLDFYVKAQNAAVQQADEAFVKQVEGWAQAVKTDKEVGGANFEPSLQSAKKFIAKFGGGPELTKVLNESGLGNHPDLFRVFARAGKALAEDSIAGSSTAVPRLSSHEEKLRISYPSMFPKE